MIIAAALFQKMLQLVFLGTLAFAVIFQCGYHDANATAPPEHTAITFNNQLVDAADKGDVEEVLSLIKQGTPIDSRGDFGVTPLMRASFRGHTKLVETLISLGADIDAVDIGGASALHLAARQGQTDIIKLLVKGDGNVDSPDTEGWTALMRAAVSKKSQSVAILLDKGANPKKANNSGENTLDYAARSGDKKTFETLSDHHLIETLSPQEKARLASIAQSKGHQDIASLITNEPVASQSQLAVLPPIAQQEKPLISENIPPIPTPKVTSKRLSPVAHAAATPPRPATTHSGLYATHAPYNIRKYLDSTIDAAVPTPDASTQYAQGYSQQSIPSNTQVTPPPAYTNKEATEFIEEKSIVPERNKAITTTIDTPRRNFSEAALRATTGTEILTTLKPTLSYIPSRPVQPSRRVRTAAIAQNGDEPPLNKSSMFQSITKLFAGYDADSKNEETQTVASLPEAPLKQEPLPLITQPNSFHTGSTIALPAMSSNSANNEEEENLPAPESVPAHSRNGKKPKIVIAQAIRVPLSHSTFHARSPSSLYWLQFGTYDTEMEAKAQMGVFKYSRYRIVRRQLYFVYNDPTSNRRHSRYRLRAGVFNDYDQASNTCDKLTDYGASCIVIRE